MKALNFSWFPDNFWANNGLNYGINFLKLKNGTKIEVLTANSIYLITKLSGNDVMVVGGKYFPREKVEKFAGSTFGVAAIKPGWICHDMNLEFGTPLYYILTSRVRNAIIHGDGWVYDMGWC